MALVSSHLGFQTGPPRLGAVGQICRREIPIDEWVIPLADLRNLIKDHPNLDLGGGVCPHFNHPTERPMVGAPDHACSDAIWEDSPKRGGEALLLIHGKLVPRNGLLEFPVRCLNLL